MKALILVYQKVNKLTKNNLIFKKVKKILDFQSDIFFIYFKDDFWFYNKFFDFLNNALKNKYNYFIKIKKNVYDLFLIKTILKILKKNIDFVNCSFYLREKDNISIPLEIKLKNFALEGIINKTFENKLSDFHLFCYGFKIDIFSDLILNRKDNFVEIELILKFLNKKVNILEIPYHQMKKLNFYELNFNLEEYIKIILEIFKELKNKNEQ
jgi:hypothetical protein